MADLSAIKLPNGTTYTIKDVDGRKEAYLDWGGRNLTTNVTPIGASLSNEHSANRIAYLNPAAIQIEYTTNGGSTWTDSGYTNDDKMWLCTGNSGIAVGQSKSGYSQSTALTTNHWTRITLTGQDGTHQYVYTSPRKLLVNVSTAISLNCLVEYKTGVSGASWQTFGTYAVSGWSAWNDIPLILSTFGGGSTQTSNCWYLRFTFKVASTRTDAYKGHAEVLGLRLFGVADWGSASNNNNKGPFSSTGHLYSYDVGANATFPAKVTATGGFSGDLTGNVTGNVSGSAGSVAWSGVGSKPTTISGYGITDAKIASGVITLGSNTITPLTSSSTLSAAKLSGAIPSAVTAKTQASTDNSTKIATTAYVTTAIANLPDKVYGELTKLSSDMSLTTTAQKVPLTSFTGSGCALSSNGIKVNEAGIYIISGSAYLAAGFNSLDVVHVEVWVNNSVANVALTRLSNANYYITVNVAPFVYSLSANDVVYLYAYNQNGARGKVADQHKNGLCLFRIA